MNDGVARPTAEHLVERVRGIAEAMAGVGKDSVSALTAPGRRSVVHLLTTLDQLLDQVPPIHEELDVVLSELHAQRLSVQSVRAQLEALDAQLEVLERSLAPLQTWSDAWTSARDSLDRAVALLET
ncbi:hypothetical protein E8D34_18845 [Nocardioides sp. GY 10113]|uniref:hypothetical protein n=1 Tax=Nocardioides sp. GY 10113 TaxID=2569761 RepID=UPI0010A87D89|nr:hypothetical protein [Nocardioides sp. GY 10113]TIC80444.1 hypothetical protein E8D34_18845 [Nocardioides sp. GY 10113]